MGGMTPRIPLQRGQARGAQSSLRLPLFPLMERPRIPLVPLFPSQNGPQPTQTRQLPSQNNPRPPQPPLFPS